MYYELILTDAAKELLEFLQNKFTKRYKTVYDQYWALRDMLTDEGSLMEEEYDTLDRLEENCEFYLNLKNLLLSFNDPKSIKIPQNQFNHLRTTYLFHDENLDKLLGLFQKRSNTNTNDNKHSYLKQALLNSYQLSKENLPPLNPNLMRDKNLQAEPTTKRDLKLS